MIKVSFALNIENKDRIDVFRKPSKPRFETEVSFFMLAKVDRNICNWAQKMPVLGSHPVD